MDLQPEDAAVANAVLALPDPASLVLRVAHAEVGLGPLRNDKAFPAYVEKFRQVLYRAIEAFYAKPPPLIGRVDYQAAMATCAVCRKEVNTHFIMVTRISYPDDMAFTVSRGGGVMFSYVPPSTGGRFYQAVSAAALHLIAEHQVYEGEFVRRGTISVKPEEWAAVCRILKS